MRSKGKKVEELKNIVKGSGRPPKTRGKLDKTDLPKNIVNKEAYESYLKLKAHPMLNENRLYYTSDPNLIIDLAEHTNRIKKAIIHLPEPEQKDITAQFTAVRALLGNLSSLKVKSYGMVRGRNFIEDNSFLAPRQTELLELFGRFYTSDEVHKIVNQEWNLDISRNAVNNFRVKNLDKITELQEKYKRDYSHVRLGYKRSRLDELSFLYNKRKDLFHYSPSVDNHKLMLATLEQIRKETDGDELKVTFEGELNVHTHISLHIQQDLVQKLSIKEIVLAKLAAKFGVSSQLLLFRLNKSFYAKFTGTKEAENNLMEDEIIYPSQSIYDFEKIKRANQAIRIEEAVIVEDEKKEEVKKTTSVSVDVIKQTIMAKLRKKAEEINGISDHLSEK